MTVPQHALGQSDLRVGSIAYGCWRFATGTVQDADTKIQTALDHGLTLIDTADIYGFGEPSGFGGAETLLGEVIAASPELRQRMVLTTKGGIIPPRPYDSTQDYLLSALDASLARLKTDHVELYQIHRPDLTTPFAETARALNSMLKSGRVGHIGVSNFTPAQSRALAAYLDKPLLTVQPEFSALAQDPITDGTLDYAGEIGASVLAWSPLAGGALAAGYRPEGADKTRFTSVMAVIDRLSASYDATRTQIALAFTMAHGAHVIPIIGTQKPKRIIEAAGAAEIILTARDFYDIIEAYRGKVMP